MRPLGASLLFTTTTGRGIKLIENPRASRNGMLVVCRVKIPAGSSTRRHCLKASLPMRQVACCAISIPTALRRRIATSSTPSRNVAVAPKSGGVSSISRMSSNAHSLRS